MSISLQSISYQVKIAGRVLANVLEIQTSAGFDQINAEATVWVPARPSGVDERQTVEIYARNSATAAGWLLRGEITGFDWTYSPTRVGIVCGDLLARTRDDWGGDDYEYTSQTSAAVVRNGLEKKGIPSSQAHIEGDDWIVGVITPITLKSGDDVYGTLIQPLDDMEGYRTFSRTSGVIVRLRTTGAVGGAALTYSQGVQILGGPRHNRTANGIVNRVILTGVEYEGLTIGGPGVGEASAPNPYVTDPSGFVTERLQSNLIEDDDTALLFAQRRVADKNRRPEGGEFEVPLDPRAQPGMGIKITQPGLELSGVTVRVQHVAHGISGTGAKTAIRWTGGVITAPALLPPMPNFTIELFAEAEDTGSGVDPLVILIADGSQSYDPDGTIASYAWTITTDGTATPDSGTEPVLRSVISGSPTTITVDLVVTDNDGLTGELPLTSPIDTGAILIEDIYGADGDMLCSSDGELTWRIETPASGSATCLMPIAPIWQCWGTDTGHIYASFDKLQTPPLDFGTPHGSHACTAVWIHEEDATRLWVGFDDGAVYFATVDLTAFAASWSPHSLIPEWPIVEIRESVGTLGELRATAGQGYYYRTGVGSGWELQHTFDTAWRMAAGFETNLASGLNDVAPLYDEDGTPPTVPGGVEHIRGLSFGYRDPVLYAANDAAQLFTGAAPDFNLTLHADSTDGITNHMIRSGNIDGVVYLAIGDGTGSNNGFQKWIPGAAAPFYIKRTGTDAGLMIGYGALHLPPVVVILLMVGGNLGGGIGVFRYNPVTGVWDDVSGDLPVSGWDGICASPLNHDHWIVWRSSAAYRTTNAGVNWTQLTPDLGTLFGATQLEFSPTVLTDWALIGSAFDSFNGVHYGWVARGSGDTVTENVGWISAAGPFSGPAVQSQPTSLTYSTNDDLIVAIEHDAAIGDCWVIFPSGVPLAGIGTPLAVPAGFRAIDGVVGRTPIVGVATDPSGAIGELWTATGGAPGRLAQLDPTFGMTTNGMAAAALDAMYVATSSGIARVAYAGGTGSIVYAAGIEPAFIRADRQRRTAIAVLYEDMATYPGTPFRVAVYDGSSWSSVAAAGNYGPLGSISPWIEVLS